MNLPDLCPFICPMVDCDTSCAECLRGSRAAVHKREKERWKFPHFIMLSNGMLVEMLMACCFVF
jgi:hypothetical protein